MTHEKAEVKYKDLRIAWVFDYILQLFDLRDLVSSFSRRGYTTLKREELLLPIGSRLGGSGVIARKGEFDVYVDTGRQIVGIRGSTEFTKLTPFYQEVRNIIAEDFEVDFVQNLRYCELLSEIRTRSKKAIEKIRDIPLKRVTELENIIGEYALVGFRIGSKTSYPTMTNWFDIEIHPMWARPENFYEIGIVYRNESEERVLFFARNLENVVSSILKIVEEGVI